MSHHSSIQGSSELLRRLQSGVDEHKLGATGRFPDGKLNEHDEGEIAIGIAHDAQTGKIVMNFGQPTAWIGFTKDQARDIARVLNNLATG